MATKKSTSAAKKSTTKKSTPAKKATTTKVTTVKAVAATPGRSTSRKGFTLPDNAVNIVIAEIVGTFILTLVALLAASSLAPLYVGLTFLVLVVTIGAISGSHLNPAITFGLWSARRLKSILLPFYWVAQFVGAMGAVVILSLLTNGSFGLDFSGFWNLNWSLLVIELVGTAVFAFGFVAALTKNDASVGTRAVGAGLSLAAGLLVASSLLSAVQGNVDKTTITAPDKIPHELRVKGAVLNPAIALATTENTDAQLWGSTAEKNDKQVSRLGVEVILGTLVGAAVGANLWLVTSYRNRR